MPNPRHQRSWLFRDAFTGLRWAQFDEALQTLTVSDWEHEAADRLRREGNRFMAVERVAARSAPPLINPPTGVRGGQEQESLLPLRFAVLPPVAGGVAGGAAVAPAGEAAVAREVEQRRAAALGRRAGVRAARAVRGCGAGGVCGWGGWGGAG